MKRLTAIRKCKACGKKTKVLVRISMCNPCDMKRLRDLLIESYGGVEAFDKANEQMRQHSHDNW